MKQRFFQIAKAMTYKSDHHTHKMGAVLVRKNRVISVGSNKIKTNRKSNHPWSMTHAELDCILGVNGKDLSGADLYIFRQHKNGNPACSKPCVYCQQLIISAGIKNVFYTDNGGFVKL